jgi:hypothetical protein
MDVKQRDICGVTDVRGSTEFICTKPPHAKLLAVRDGDTPQSIKKALNNPHRFESRYPYRTKEN